MAFRAFEALFRGWQRQRALAVERPRNQSNAQEQSIHRASRNAATRASDATRPLAMWTSHQNPENGLTYYFNSATGISTYTPPPDLAVADKHTLPPPTPGKLRSNLTRSSSFVKSAAQRKLVASLPDAIDPSDDDIDSSGRVNLEPPTSPTRGADRQVAPGWKIGGGSKANRCTNARHQQALALAAEPSLSMAAAFTQSVVAANAHGLASAHSLALRALEDGKIATPAMVEQVRAVAKGETPLRPHPLSDDVDDEEEGEGEAEELVAMEAQAPLWQQLTTTNSDSNSNGNSNSSHLWLTSRFRSG